MKSTLNKKKILMICHFGINENTPRSYRSKELIKCLHERGYIIDVVIGKKKKIL